MLPHYSPFKVAEVFRVLDALAPGRIDLGLGRAPGSDGRTAFALNPLANERPEHFPADVRDLMAWVQASRWSSAIRSRPCKRLSRRDRRRRKCGCWAAPTTARRSRPCSACPMPTPGSSRDGAGGGRRSRSTSKLYRPSARHPEPHSGLCVWALAADTRTRRSTISPRARCRLLRDRGILVPLDPPDVAAKELAKFDQARVEGFRQKSFVGTGPEVAARIEELRSRIGVDEMAVVTWTWDEEVRRKSYTLLARAMGFAPALAIGQPT